MRGGQERRSLDWGVRERAREVRSTDRGRRETLVRPKAERSVSSGRETLRGLPERVVRPEPLSSGPKVLKL